MGFLEFITGHFTHALPILIAGVFSVVIIIDRYRTLFHHYSFKDGVTFFHQLQDLVLAGKNSEALALCDRYPEKLSAKLAKTALLRAHLPESLIEDGLAIEMNEATEKVQKRTSFLAMIANVATLLGLLGTIAGLIQSFEAVGVADASQKSTILAQGISVAMNATMLGLGVAIPSMVAFSILMNKSNRLLSELEGTGIRMLDLFKQRIYTKSDDDRRSA